MGVDFEKEKLELQRRVIQYATDIQDGTIPTGQKTKWGIDRFFNDLKNPKWYVDWNELMKFNRWGMLFKHTKGVLAGKPILLSDFQLYLVTNILCFKNTSNNRRRYREAYIQLARKNAKSQLLSILDSYVAFLSEEQEEVPITGYAREQSSLVYNEILSQIRNAPMLQGKYSDSYGKITVHKNGSVIRPLSREARKFGEGTSPSFVTVDEYHTHPDDEIIEVQRTGVMARKNPMIVFITTAGLNLESPCFSFYEYCTEILNPDLDTENDDIFVAIYELDPEDDVKDERNWIKSNPLLATYEEGLNSLRSTLKTALDQPEKMRSFLTKNMNLWVDHKEDGYVDMKKWNNQAIKPSEMEGFLYGANIYLGLDLSMTTDLTSMGWVAVKNGEFLIGGHSFVPEDKFNERMSKDKVRYDLFEDLGYLTKTPGAVVDYNFVMQYVLDFANKYGCKMVCYDKWNASHLAQELENKGLEMIEIPQSISQLSEPTKKFREELYNGKLKHLGDPLMRWAVNNAVLKLDQQENVMIGKQVSKDRIDPIASVINAFSQAMYDDMTVDLNEYILSDGFSF